MTPSYMSNLQKSRDPSHSREITWKQAYLRAMCTSYRVLKNQGLKFLTHHQMIISYKVNGSLDLS